MEDDDRLIGVSSYRQLNANFKILNNANVFLNKNNFVLGLAEVILALNCIIGDYYIFDSDKLVNLITINVGLSQRLVRAMMDNGSHSFIGILSWFIISYPNISLIELAVSGLFSSFIDLDHFISARSFSLINATSLPKRPFLHNSLTLLIANIIFSALSTLFANTDRNWVSLIFICWFSHHVRDANRHGLWFGSVYSTPRIKDSLYLTIILIQPLVFRFFIHSNYKIFYYPNILMQAFSNNSSNLANFKKEEIHLV